MNKYEIKIKDLKISERAKNVLLNLGAENVYDVINIPLNKIKNTVGVGKSTFQEIENLITITLNNESENTKENEHENKNTDTNNSQRKTKKKLKTLNVTEVGFSERAKNCLTTNGINTIQDLLDADVGDIRNYRGIGKKTLDEILTKRTFYTNDKTSIENKEILSNEKIQKVFQDLNINDDKTLLAVPLITYKKNEIIRKPDFITIVNLYATVLREPSNKVTLKQYLFGSADVLIVNNDNIVNDIPIKQVFTKIITINVLLKMNINTVNQLLNTSCLLLLENLSKVNFEDIEEVIPKIIVPIEKNEEKLTGTIKTLSKAIEHDYKVAKIYQFITPLFNNEIVSNKDVYEKLINENDNENELLTNDKILELIYSNPKIEKYAEMIMTTFLTGKKYTNINNFKTRLPKHYLNSNLYEKIINNLKQKNRIIIKNNKIILKDLTFNEFIQTLPDEKYRFIMDQRAKGKSLEEIGNTVNLTRERIRQIEKKALERKVFVYEDIYKSIFEKYDITEEIFKYIFEEKESTYKYLQYMYKRGSKELDYIFKDPYIDDEIKIKYENYLDLSKVYINGTKVKKNRKDLLNYYIKTNCKGVTKFDDFYKGYSQFITEITGDFEKYGHPHRYLEGRLPFGENTIWTHGHSFRYFNKQLIDIKILLKNLELDTYKNIEITTRFIFNKNKEYLTEIDIQDEYELHNFIKTYEICIPKYYKLKLTRSPGLIFGNGNHKTQLETLINENPYMNNTEISKLYEEKYGVLSSIVYMQYFPEIDYRKPTLKLINKTTNKTDENILKEFKKHLDSDYYLLETINNLFKNYYPKAEKLSGYDFDLLGYRFTSQILYSKEYNSLADFLAKLFENNIVDFSGKLSELYSQSTIYNYLYSMQAECKIIEFAPKKFINVTRLNILDVTYEDIMDYCTQVEEKVGLKYFTLESLKQTGFTHKIYKLGFDDYFYESILRFSSNCKSISIGFKRIFRFVTDTFSVTDFIVNIVEREKSIDIYDLQNLLEKTYGINIDIGRISTIAQNSELYYSDTMERIYIDYDEFYKEF